MLTQQPLPPLSLYIHIPWCLRKCPYCDFNSHTSDGPLPEAAYIDALIVDLNEDLAAIGQRPIESIFIGGGTPSLFSPSALERLLNTIADRCQLVPAIEITMEANPGSAESDRFAAYRQLGINRLSIGIQSFDDSTLAKLGRIHDAQQARNAVVMAQQAGFDNYNIDLMFGLPDQSRQAALDDLQQALDLAPSHLSRYQLTIEPNTWFHRYPPSLPNDERIWQMQCDGEELLQQHGFDQYEVSAFARPGKQCRHNLNYWRFGDYHGIGAGAHSKITYPEESRIERIWKIKHPQRYLSACGNQTAERIGGRSTLQSEDRTVEFMMNLLRLKEGFDRSLFTARTGLPLAELEPAVTALIKEGLLELIENRVRCTQHGAQFLDTVLERFT